MKKKFLLIVGLFLCVASFALAEGIEGHLGIGYFASFLETPIEVHPNEFFSSYFKDSSDTVTVRNKLLGAIIYGGVGYGFGASQAFSMGLDFALSGEASTNPFGAFSFSLHGRGFGKYGPSKNFSVTAYSGVKGDITPILTGSLPKSAYPEFGVRVTVSIFYLEYAAVLKQDFSSFFSHDVSVGFSIIEK